MGDSALFDCWLRKPAFQNRCRDIDGVGGYASFVFVDGRRLYPGVDFLDYGLWCQDIGALEMRARMSMMKMSMRCIDMVGPDHREKR